MLPMFFKKEPLLQLPENVIDKAKFKARIAFIDNEQTSYIDKLRQDGYNATYFDDIQNMDDFLQKQYQVVIIDVQTSGKNLSPNEAGWGILRYLKDNYPHILVIIYTKASYSITKYYKLANRADEVFDKNIEFLDFKTALDKLIRKAFSPDYHLAIIKSKLSGKISDSKSLQEISRIIENYGGNEFKVEKLLKKYIIDPELIKSIILSISVINKFKDLVTGQ
jgi:DNA-binding NtrC family response regulator